MIDWSKPVCTSHETPHIGLLLPDCPLHGRKRVAIFSPSQTGIKGSEGKEKSTVFRYDADGKTRGDGRPSPNDLHNFDRDDGAVRIGLDGYKAVCSAARAA